MQKSWHNFTIKKTFQELKSGIKGINETEANKRLRKFGLNNLPEEKSFSRLKLLIGQINSPLVYILFIAGITALALGEYTDSIIIFGVVVLNTLVGYLQESKANQALSKLKKVFQLKTIVFRNGKEKEIFQKYLVPGDVIFLRAGNKVPGDARIIESHDLKINESSLTGEWLAAKKDISVLSEGISLADRNNIAYMGTIIESGWGKAVVVATGIKTEIGKIAEAIKETEEEKTPYQKKLSRFSKIIGVVIIIISSIIFIEGMITGGRFIEIFTTSIAIAVAAVPEGLPVAMTVILAIGMQKILKKKGLVRKLASAETLGSTSIILTDKTGTLTEAKMEVAGIFTGNKGFFDNNDKKLVKGFDKKDGKSHTMALKIAMLCNESFIENYEEPTEKWIIRGSPTERSLFLAGIQAGFSRKELDQEQPLIDRFLFDSNYKYAASLHKLDPDSNILYIVGSPEKILSMSSYLDINRKKKKLFLSDFKKLKERYEKLTKQGFRVIAVAYKKTKDQKIDKDKEEELKEMVSVGFFALHDPIRKGTKEVMDTCRKAGMKPIIVTGDHKLTAIAVAEKLGFKTKKENILEGKDLDRLSDKEFEKKLKHIEVYVRVEPNQKLRIVQAWQKQGEVVAMTGDGINDAPALKQADIGIALGSGTDVSKEVSDLVLLSDNFSIIESAIEEGRVIVDNIRKIITYLLSDSFTEIILISVSLLFGWPLPILAGQILWVNLIEDGPLGVSLAFEEKEKDIMERSPNDYGLFLLNKEMKVLIFIIGLTTDFLLLGLFFYLLKYSGYEIAHIRSVIFAGLTIDSLLYVFSCKSLRRNLWEINLWSNKFLILALLIGILMLLSAFYVPFLQTLLKTVPLNFFDWSLVLILGFLNIFLIEATKWLFIKKFIRKGL
ncbi:MAG: HAD-IC family P-type ATPase [Patescibacteria group bacterium]